MSKFGGSDYILVIQDIGSSGNVGADKPRVTWASKQTITNSAASYAAMKAIPLANRFSTRKSETTGPKNIRSLVDPNAGLFSPLVGKPLARLTESDKLYIFAHGNGVGIAYMADDSSAALAASENAATLAELLSDHGLSRVGLITFKACYVGRNDFLKSFAVALAGRGIACGWLKGYKGIASTVAKTGGGVTEEITQKDGTVLQSDGQGVDIVNNERYKIVRGPGGLFEGSNFGRYHGVTTAEQAKRFAKAHIEMADLLAD